MRWAGVGAAIIAAADDALYPGIVNSQGGSPPQFLRVPFVAAFIALMAICAALSSFASVGLFNALGQAKSSGETSGRAAVTMAAGGAVLSVVVLLVGISFTELALRCPASGVEGGSGATLLGGSYQYSCDNGKLTILH